MSKFRESLPRDVLIYLDKQLEDGLELAYRFEQSMHQSVTVHSSLSDQDRVRYIAILDHIDHKLNIKSDRLDKAYSFLATCDLDTFWSKGLDKLKLVRQDIWDKLLDGA